jgi:hypothetical protein
MVPTELLPSSRAAVSWVQVLVVAALGLIAFPAAFGGTLNPATALDGQIQPTAGLWLVLSLLLAGWLIVIAPTLARAIAAGLARIPIRRQPIKGAMIGKPEFLLLGALIVAVSYVALVEAILRQPLDAVFGALFSPTSVDAVVAATGVLLVLAILFRLYQVARPLVEGTAWYALDTLVATAGSGTAALAVEAGEKGGPRDQATLAGTATRPLADATVAAGSLDATRLAATPIAAGNVGDTQRADPANLEATHLAVDPGATQRAGPPSETATS